MIRRACKTTGANCLHALGIDRIVARRAHRAGSPLVLCYHRVVEDVRQHPQSLPAMLVAAPTLEQQLDWVGQRFRFVGLDELARELESGRRSPRPSAAVTFDDGYADVYQHALPLLERKGIPGAVFVVADLVGSRRLHVHDELHLLLRLATERLGARELAALLRRHGVGGAALRRLASGPPQRRLVELTEELLRVTPRLDVEGWIAALASSFEISRPIRDTFRLMDWSMVRDAHRRGFTIGSHTRSHRVLPNEHDLRIASELEGSKQILERALGTEVRHLAYPGGQFCARSVEAARAAGYRHAYTTCDHQVPQRELLTIPRRVFWENTCAGLLGSFSRAVAACQVHGVFEVARPCKQRHGRETPAPAASRREVFA